MYLHDEVEDTQGNPYKTVGIIDGRCRYTGHLVNFGYTEIKEVREDVACDFREAVSSFEDSGIGKFIGDIMPGSYEELVTECDAYYGDPSAVALKFVYAKKPVMIINADV